MTSNSPRKQPPPIYVWLFAAYPIIELYGRNIDLLAGQEVLIVLALVLLGVSVIYGALRRWTKSPTRAAPLTLLITALFFSYGHVHTLLLQQLNRTESMHLICYPAAFMVFGLMAYFVWKKHRTLHKAIAYFNLTAIILLAISVAKIADFLYYDTLTKTETLPPVTVALDASETQPDVYYIILDGYSRGDWLETWFGFNNDDFLQELTARGFYIADRSCSNYIQTHLSIPSVLSMAYIEPTHASNLSEIRSLRYMNSYVRQNNRVGNVFEALGYTTIHFATHYSITAYNHDADVVIDFGPSGSFITDHADATEPYWNALLPTTLYSPFFTYQDVLAGDIYSYRSPYRVLMSLDELKAIPEYPEPTFTLAHIIKPHDPFSFDRDGNIVDDHPGWIPETDMGISRGNQRYIEQVLFVNTQILDVIDTIIAASDEPPIIILQGDHAWDSTLSEQSDPRIKRFPILNAYLVPAAMEAQLYPSITPVNSFRVMFDTLWGTDLGLLEDINYEADYSRPLKTTRLADDLHDTWCGE